MKTPFATLLLVLLTFALHAQGLPADSLTGKIVYRGAVPLPTGVTPVQAFGRAKVWLADAFTNKTILAEDAASGLLSGGGRIPVEGYIYTFRIRLQVGPAQAKYSIDNFAWEALRSGVIAHGTPEEQRDSKLAIGRAARARILATLDSKVRAGLAQLNQDLSGSL